jgi:hypothetical protein
MRELKGLEIAARYQIECKAGIWYVPSQQPGGGKYSVKLNPVSCTCDDFALTGKPCKHVHAARLVCARDHGGKAPDLDTDAIPKKPTYKQDWPKYNRAQLTEQKRFMALLHDLCAGVVDPPRKPTPGQKPAPLRDQIFACALKVYSTFSSRRFAGYLQDAAERGYLTRLMHSVSVCAFLENGALTPVLERLIVQSSLPLKSVETVFAPDSSGFSTSRFVRWFDEKYGVERSGKAWVKAHIMTGTTTNIVTAVVIDDQYAADCPQFKPLVEKTAENFTIKEVPADKAYLSKENLELVAGLGGTAFVPYKSNSSPEGAGGLWEKMYHYFQYRRDDFLKHYHQRSNVESTFSMTKAKFRDHVRSKTTVAMKNEVLCKFLCHNICVTHQAHVELGIEPVFWKDEAEEAAPKDVLLLVRPG